MVLESGEILWSLEELSQHSQQELLRRKIPNPGGRVSQVLSARTIRYYTSLGLVDRPLSYDGGVAKYGPRHLLQLLAIKILQAEYLPLPEIQKQLFGLTEQELTEVVQSASREEDSTENKPLARNETWVTRRVLPGLRLLIDERELLAEWLRCHSCEEAVGQIWNAVQEMTLVK